MAPGTPRERIAIVGGGIASLTAAYHLSCTPALRARYDVTIYQMGWRLGGKLASGRNPDMGQRNEEHGLHVWFGFYNNAFNLAQSLFERWAKPHGCPFQTWRDAFEPQSFTPIGERVGAGWDLWPVDWPVNSDEPGGDDVELSFWGVITEFLSAIERLLEAVVDSLGLNLGAEIDVLPDAVESFIQWALSKVAPGKAIARQIPKLLEQARHLVEALDDDDDGDGVGDNVEEVAASIRWLVTKFNDLLQEHLEEVDNTDLSDLENVLAAIDVAVAFVAGLLNPAYDILADGNLDRIDHLEFRQWLLDNGARQDVVENWSGIRALYDTAFQYTDGFTDKPSFAAGAAARVCIRIVFTYKGAVLYLINSGMGETLISPIYEVLRDQGVDFEFFHKLTGLELSPDTNVLTRARFERQVDIKNGASYAPLFTCKGLRCWPNTPFWDQIEDGAAMQAADVNWESHWNDWPVAGHLTLEQGKDFDRLLLGASLGAFKTLNAQDPNPAAEIIAAKPIFKSMTEALPLVPNCGLQLWFDRTLEELGWVDGRPATVAWAYPMDIWTDMTPTLKTEAWPIGDAPKSVHYLCGSFGSELYREPATATATPQQAFDVLWAQVVSQLESVAGSIWPDAVDPSGILDWALLHAPAGTTGLDRLRAQYLRANVEPTECCVGTPADSVRYRLEPNQTGVTNLLICGAWTRTGINASCVEGAVISGMKAARAITTDPLLIVGEYFMGPQD